MSMIRRIAATALSICLCAVLPVATSVADQGDLGARLDSAIAAKVAEMGVPGAIVGIVVPGEIDYLTAVGVGDTATGMPMTVDEHTRIGSVTKTFTGTAVLQLVDQGRIRLDDPISAYVDGVPSGDAITLDMLGRMRSGLFDYTQDDEWLSRVYLEAPSGPDAFAFTPQQVLDIAFSHPSNFAPNGDYQYSNTNTVLLGLVVERVTGLPIGDFLQQNIFDRLQLTQTSFPRNGLMPAPFPRGYTRAPDGKVVDAALWNPSWADAAGAIVSTYADLRTWASALGRGTLLSPQTQARRLEDPSAAAPGAGYSFAIFDTHGWIGHNGDIPGYTTVLVYLPERDATLVVMVNSDVPENHSAGQIAEVVTTVVTPDHVYDLAHATPI